MLPIFIGGCPRSGTTVLGAVLGMHNKCITIPESYFKVNLFRSYALEKEQFDSSRFITSLQEKPRFKIWNTNVSLTPDQASQLDGAPARLMEYIVQQYGRKIGETKADFWVDHTPSNLIHTKTLLELFPAAKMIHIIRDGRAIASSVIPLDWGPNVITKAAHWWAECIAHGLSYESFLSANQIIRIRYEDLISQPEPTISKLCDFLDIDYQPTMLEAAGFNTPSYTTSQHKLVGQRLDINRITAWEKRLTQREVEIFEKLTGDLLVSFGYTIKYGNMAAPVSGRELRRLALEDASRRLFNRVRKAKRTQRAVRKGFVS